MGNKYIRERPLEEIVEGMMKPADAPEESDKEEETAPAASQPSVSATASVPPKDSNKGIQPAPKKGSALEIKEPSPVVEEIEVKEEVKPKF